MKKVALKVGSKSFARAPIPAKIQKTREIVADMTGNVNFSNPNPALGTVTNAVNDLETKHEAAADGGKTLKNIMRAANKVLNDLMSQLESYVENASGGDELKIVSSGMTVKTKGVRKKRTFTAQAGKNPGEVLLTAEKAEGGKSHVWQYCPDPPPSEIAQRSANPNPVPLPLPVVNVWATQKESSAGKVTLSGLPSGTKGWFREASILTKGGQTPWTDPASVTIP